MQAWGNCYCCKKIDLLNQVQILDEAVGILLHFNAFMKCMNLSLLSHLWVK